MENQIITVRGKVAFPSMTRLDQMSNKYSVQIANLSDAAVEKLEELGVAPKFKDDTYGRGQFVECKSNYPIANDKFTIVVDDQGLPMDPDTVGPGSVVKATLKTYDWKMGGRSGVGTRLVKMQVEEIAVPEAAITVSEEEVL